MISCGNRSAATTGNRQKSLSTGAFSDCHLARIIFAIEFIIFIFYKYKSKDVNHFIGLFSMGPGREILSL